MTGCLSCKWRLCPCTICRSREPLAPVVFSGYQQIRKWRCPLSSTSVFIKLICSGLARELASLTATQSLDERFHSGQYQKGELLTWSHVKASSRDLFFWGVELWKSRDMSKTIILCWKEKSYSNVLRPARMTKEVSWQWNVSMVGFENLCHHAFRSLQISCSQSFKTSGNPSSDEMWRWHGEKPVSPVVTQSSPQHSRLPVHLSLFSWVTMTNVLHSCHQPLPPALCRDDGVKGPCLHCPPFGWLLTVQGCNRPVVIYSFSWLL